MEIEKTLNSYLTMQEDKYQRFNSWKHCFDFFNYEYFNTNENEKDDLAALHLGFYLASWGMYRGSTFLLQNDYKIHTNVVKYLKDEYQRLNNNVCDISFDKINELKSEIVDLYKLAHPNSSNNNKPSNTLITKILLGTFGCIPAYDRYFLKGINSILKKQDGSFTFSKKSFDMLVNIYDNNKEEFDKAIQVGTGINYPKMKILDMYFWQRGLDIETDEKRNRINS